MLVAPTATAMVAVALATGTNGNGARNCLSEMELWLFFCQQIVMEVNLADLGGQGPGQKAFSSQGKTEQSRAGVLHIFWLLLLLCFSTLPVLE